jgi:flagellin
MGLSINQNIAAVNSYRNLSNTQNDLSKSLEKLSSGFRINRAADDAAGLAISEGLRSQVGGLKVAARNAQDGISVVQTAEGALTEVHSILQRLRDLGVQAANDSNNGSARTNITTEATSLVEELRRIGNSTNFNGIKLLDGSAGTLSFQIGADGNADSRIQVNLGSVDMTAVADALAFGSTAVKAVRTTVDADDFDGDWQFTQGSTVVTVDLGDAPTTTQGLVDKLNADAGFRQNFAASLNDDGDLVVTAKSTSTEAIVIATDTAEEGTFVDLTVAEEDVTIGFGSHTAAQAAIGLIDEKIGEVSTARANLGAMQNRFEHTIRNINVAVENLSASESRIRDTDMASEIVSFTRAQILSQAGTAMLAQANQIPQSVLSLLR